MSPKNSKEIEGKTPIRSLKAGTGKSVGMIINGDGAPSNKDLLQCEQKTSLLEKRLLECTNGEDSPKAERPVITPLPESSVLGRLKSFLPCLDQANQKLFSEIEKRGAEGFNIESVNSAEARYVEMDLALGVADVDTPEALAAAELAANGQLTTLDVSESDSDSDEEDDIGGNMSNDCLLSRSKESHLRSGTEHQDYKENVPQNKKIKIELL